MFITKTISELFYFRKEKKKWFLFNLICQYYLEKSRVWLNIKSLNGIYFIQCVTHMTILEVFMGRVAKIILV